MAKDFLKLKIKNTSSLIGLDLTYFVSGGFWFMISNASALVGGVLLSALFARIWPKDVLGQFSFLMSAIAFISITALPGMTETVFQASIEKKDGVFREAMKKIIYFSLLGALILIFGSVYFFLRSNQNLALSVFFASLAFPFSTLGSLAIAFYNGKKDFRKSSLISTTANLFSIGMTAIALVYFRNFVVVTIFSTWSTAIVNILFTYSIFKNTKSLKTDRRLIKLGLTLSATQIVYTGLDYLDKLLIPIFLGFEKNAVYYFAILIPLQIQGFFKMFLALGQSKISEVSPQEVRRVLFFKSMLLEVLITLIVVLYILICPFIFKILYPSYHEAILLSQIFSLSLLYYPSNIFGAYLVKRRIIKWNFIATIIYGISSVLSLLMFLYFWGLIGAIISKIFAKIVQIAITQVVFLHITRKVKS